MNLAAFVPKRIRAVVLNYAFGEHVQYAIFLYVPKGCSHTTCS